MQLPNLKSLSLSNKILIPFCLFLLLLGLTATFGSVRLITHALQSSLNEHLTGIRDLLAYQIKKEESDLITYARLLQKVVKKTPGLKSAPAETAALLSDLERNGITTSLVGQAERDLITDNSLRQLIDHASRSGRPRIRFLAHSSFGPALGVALADQENPDSPAIYLEKSLGRDLFAQAVDSFNAGCYLFDQNGNLLLSTDEPENRPPLRTTDLPALISGDSIYHDADTGTAQRFLFSAVPLGTTDLILLAVASPTGDLSTLLGHLTTRSAITILIVLIVGGLLFFQFVRYLLRPVGHLLQATQQVSSGNLGYRINEQKSSDELGQLAVSFNSMVGQLADLWQAKTDNERQLTLAQEELKYKDLLEAKNAEIERANKEQRLALKELSALLQLNQAMTSSLDLGVLFDRMLAVLKDLLGCKLVLLLYNHGAEELEVRKTLGLDPDILRDVVFRLDEGVTGRAATQQELIHIADINEESNNLNYKGRIITRGAMISVPLTVKRRLCGVLNLHHDEVDGFSSGDAKLIQAVGNQAAIAIENSQLYEKARNLSNTDELTNLANRRHFQSILQREVAQAKRYHSYFSMIMIDIDHFKVYNDNNGHLKGDIVLRKVADSFLQNTRGIDLVARFGGEEFVVLLPKTEKEGAMAAAEKLRTTIATTEFAGATESQPDGKLTISLGVATYPEDSKDIFELLDLADRALYRAKETGRNRTILWEPSLSAVS